ncbi:hepatitis A virus cellular receptor 2 homolog [Anabas testudineus]|uniref:hepatitis A virus cellular receptor 2 homolog n=1 Tax=Anabas testudineus TaxID=64144 RepID=UPI000E462C4C|nr:hepatitis A virus cellular receptor 2 homolog [Anabas testudineus]
MKTLKIFLLLFLRAAAVSGEVAEVLPVVLGEDVTLPCYGPVQTTGILVEWTRPDLVSPEYVFLFRDERSYTTFQHLSFVGRVELKDKKLKGGDVSLILRNVSSLDGGVYECRVSRGGEGREKRANIKTEPVRVICLEVEESGGKKRKSLHIGFGASLALGVVMAVILVGILILRKYNTILHEESEKMCHLKTPGSDTH